MSILLLMISLFSCSKKSTLEKENITTYQDSLKKYFSDSDVSHIKQYIDNYHHLLDPRVEGFYRFFKNGSTLVYMLNKRLEQVSRKVRQEKLKELPPIEWFHKVTPSIRIIRVYDNLVYKAVFDYEALHEKSLETEGEADEEFIQLLKMCFTSKTHFPRWKKHTSDNKICSVIGTSIHKNILTYISMELQHSLLFKQEIMNIEHNLIKDLLNAQDFCEPNEKILQELEEIKSMALLKQEKQIGLIEEKIQQVQAM